MTCSTHVLTKFFEYLKAHFHPQVASNSHHIDKVTRLCTLLGEKNVQINPLNAVVELELLGNRIDVSQLMEVRLDSLNRNDLDRIRNSIKSNLVRHSDQTEAINFWNTIMAKGPDSIAGGETPTMGTTVETWLTAMIGEADKLRTKMLDFLPYMTDTFQATWATGRDGGLGPTPPLHKAPPPSHAPPAIPSSTLPIPSSSQGGGGGGSSKSSVGMNPPPPKTDLKPKPVFHCQACGRKDAWHKDGTRCPALLKGSPDANPLWDQGVTWEASTQGVAAMARGLSNAFPPRGKYHDRDLDPESEWEGFECSHIHNIGKGCSTVLIFPFNPHLVLTSSNPTPIQNQENPARDRLEARGLIDTGADLSFISERLAGILKKRGVGVEGKGNYKVVDAFLKVHFFKENITLNFFFKDLINLRFK